MKITSAEFITSAVAAQGWPRDRLPEIALIGRSNVGKSSLINSFTMRKALAKTSSTPGKTRTINFYSINGEFRLVDLPGFGYAKVSHEERRSWEGMIGEYLSERRNLKGAFLILDPRRDAGEAELKLYDWIEGFGIPVSTVFTKIDKLSKNQLASRLKVLKKIIPAHEAVLFSATTGEGKLDLGKKICEMISAPPPRA